MTEQDFKRVLLDTANSLRGSVSAAEFKYPVLALVFLKYVSDVFDAQATVIRERFADPEQPDYFIEDEETRKQIVEDFVNDRDAYEQDNVFWIPEESRYPQLLKYIADEKIPQRLDDAMKSIEEENPELTGVLYRDFARLEMPAGKLGELVTIVDRLKFDPDTHSGRDIFGEVYEYFLGEFAALEGKKAGEFYTPKSVVNLMVEILAPFKGKIYDPACGTGGMFVQSLKFMKAHEKSMGKEGDLPIYGQEMMAATRRLAVMNLAVQGMRGNLGKTYASTFTNDQHPNLRADYILANPPFNISNWSQESLIEDARWKYGLPPANNANFAWLQHMLARLSNTGRAGIVLANGSMSTTTSSEGNIREAMIKGDVVECMVALPAQLFTNTTIPACIWFLSKDKKTGKNGSIDRSNKVLFIDARKLGQMMPDSRTQKHLLDEELYAIAQTYHRWRGTEFSDGKAYKDKVGFCKSADFGELEEQNFDLTSGRYVGSDYEDLDDETFEEKMAHLTALLGEQLEKSLELDAVIKSNFEEVGYEV